MTEHPRQVDGLDITEVDDGLVVFDPQRRRVHHLNVTASLIFELCTGDNPVERIIEVVRHVHAEQAEARVRDDSDPHDIGVAAADALAMLRNEALVI